MIIARDALQGFSFDEAAFADFLRARPDAQPVHGGELLLIFLCLAHDARALERFERDHFAPLQSVVAAIDSRSNFVADVLQELRTKLYAEGRLSQYRGRGPVSAWLRRAAVNTAAMLLRPSRREDPLDPLSDEVVDDAELSYLKQRYREPFRRAFIDALQSLSPRERTVLRLNSLSGVSIDELGVMYRVHRATAARWVQRAREQIIDQTRALLIARLALSTEEALELVALMRSQLDVSLTRYLRDVREGPRASEDESG